MTAIRLCAMVLFALPGVVRGEDFTLTLRTVVERPGDPPSLERQTRREAWPASQTAVIVCDTWDLHHCLNAVRRLEEFAPQIDRLVAEARRRGAVVIHAPSDCMPAYEGHPARERARRAPRAEDTPRDVAHWCSRIPAEERGVYPLDQSDGGEDDDPAEHAAWVAKLKSLERNPGTPWKTQSPLVAIDPEHDYISDRGDEVWNILRARGIRHVLLTGVHTNMCVLGRPFGMRQLVRNGMQVALVRDLTDCMYNPRRWPFVNHFTGNELLITHVERFVGPTVTSDQILGGKPLRSRFDTREQFDILSLPTPQINREDLETRWTLATLPGGWKEATGGAIADHGGPAWYRCAVRVPKTWGESGLVLELPAGSNLPSAWCNGEQIDLQARKEGGWSGRVRQTSLALDDANLLVVRWQHERGDGGWKSAPRLVGGSDTLSLAGRWQIRLGDDPQWSRIPLPAKFGASPDILFELPQ